MMITMWNRRQMLVKIYQQGEKLMTLFDELKAQNDQIKALVVKVAADVATLTAAIKPDMTPAEVSELKADGQSIVDALSALDEQTPDEPVTPPQAKKK